MARIVMIKELWKLPSREDAVVLLKRPRKEIALRCEFEGNDGEPIFKEIVFEGVEALKFTYEQACGDWVMPAFNRLVEVTDSPWAAEVTEQLRKHRAAQPVVRHLMIYFDDGGDCYEAICR